MLQSHRAYEIAIPQEDAPRRRQTHMRLPADKANGIDAAGISAEKR